jgi:hypothetical protein
VQGQDAVGATLTYVRMEHRHRLGVPPEFYVALIGDHYRTALTRPLHDLV